MAKSARASDRKSARTKIRANVYAPVEEARIQRLSEKLLALAATSKPPPLMEVGEGTEPTVALKKYIPKAYKKKWTDTVL